MDLGKFTADDFVVTVPYGPPGSGATVDLRYLNKDKRATIYEKSLRHGFDPSTHQPTSKPDNRKFARLFGEATVVGWSGFEHAGEPFPFSPENRDKLMQFHAQFSDFVLRLADDLDALRSAAVEEVRGN